MEHCTIHAFGTPASGYRTTTGVPQEYSQIKQHCLQTGTLFEDPEFPCTDAAVFGLKPRKIDFQWTRPKDITQNAHLFVDGASRFDVRQGPLGNCWVVAAMANLTLNPKMFDRVVPKDQGFSPDRYCGAFHFIIWKEGNWIDVVVDDRLPTENGQLLNMKSVSGNEFWSALLEKAYAKLHGTYEALDGGWFGDAMQDFTGGLVEVIDLLQNPTGFTIMLRAHERGSLMSCEVNQKAISEAKQNVGLITVHTYSVTAVKKIYLAISKATHGFVRLRNPWGGGEWKGAWSDESPEWKTMTKEEKKAIGITVDNDGEFWMHESDFMKYFNKLEICNLSPDAVKDDVLGAKSRKVWQSRHFHGAWVPGVSAGGYKSNRATFWLNPQYFITLTDADEYDNDNKCTLIVALMQKKARAKKAAGTGEFLTIGFAIYQVNPHNTGRLDSYFFATNSSVAMSHTYINNREVTTRFKLPPGVYCILPTTYTPNQAADFLLRVFTESANTCVQMPESTNMNNSG